MNEIQYDIAIEGKGFQIKVPWGEERAKGWQTRYGVELKDAERLSLIPKEHARDLPVVTIKLDQDKRWVLFSRVYGTIINQNNCSKTKKEIRLYCIGWQTKIRGVNVKSLTWVYPNGSIESSENPSFEFAFL